jgi:uncharacterized repeat protein (TIGR01451 family)
MMTPLKRSISAFLIAVIACTHILYPAQAAGPGNFANCRLGVGGVDINDVTGYDMTQLNMGLYLDWVTRRNMPPGLSPNIEYLQVVRIHQTKPDTTWHGPPRVYSEPPSYQVKPDFASLTTRAAANPGSIWLIGNEVERVDWPVPGGWGGQDETTPEVYATAYHDIRAVIKAADPTARVGVGSIIQPTTLRLAYLDRMWNSYQAQYGHSMGQDIDLWNIHMFILPEVLNSWGAEIPAGFNNNDSDPTNNYDPAAAFLGSADYNTALAAHHSIVYYRQFLEDFREWMAAHGERNKPLINSEYGILLEDVTNNQIRAFLRNSFDYMFSATDPDTGYPYDENRLVQGWVWYSLNHHPTAFTEGALFNPSKALTNVGNEWKTYISDPAKPLASQPRANLLVTNLRTEPNPVSVPAGQTATVQLKVDVANSGNTWTDTNNNVVITFWDGPPGSPGSNLIASKSLADLPGCGRFVTAAVTWSGVPDGEHTWYVKADSVPDETKLNDNVANSSLTVVEGALMADLAVTKTVDKQNPNWGSLINYTLTATNKGPHTINNIVVNDLLPAGLIFDSFQASQGFYYPTGIWEVGTLPSQSNAVLTIKAKVNVGQGSVIVNTATITSPDKFIDAIKGNNSASVTNFPTGAPPKSGVYVPIIQKK